MSDVSVTVPDDDDRWRGRRGGTVAGSQRANAAMSAAFAAAGSAIHATGQRVEIVLQRRHPCPAVLFALHLASCPDGYRAGETRLFSTTGCAVRTTARDD